MAGKINILIIDDHELFSQGLKALLSTEDKFKIACCKDSKEMFSLIDKTKFDLILLDLNLSKEDGLALIQPIKNVDSLIKIIILTSFSSHQYSTLAINSGANAFIHKNFSKEELIATINDVLSGKTIIQNQIQESKKENLTYPINPKFLSEFLKSYKLTRREVDIISLIAQGYTNKNIAVFFHISENTVKTHRKNVKRKLKFSSTADIVKFAFDTGIMN